LSKKHELLCTSRDYREAKELAKIRKLDVVIIGRHGGGVIRLGNFLLILLE